VSVRSTILLCAGSFGLALFASCSGNGDLTPPTGHFDGAPPSDAPSAPPPDAAQPDAAPPKPDVAPDLAADMAVGEFIPCDVEAVLKAKCHVCHTDPPLMCAPRPLLTYQNIAPVRMLMEMYLKIDFMPYVPPGAAGPPNGPLSPAQKATLLDWLAKGGLPAPQKCP
jgi:hypothetical protein